MHDLEPYYNWQKYYDSEEDEYSPFYGVVHNELQYETTIYGYFIHPQWDFFGSETLYIKILYTDYDSGACIMEFIGEWNDAINNDIMHLLRNVVEPLMMNGITKFLLIGENLLNFHGSDDTYYEEWFEEIESEGWIVAIGFHEHVKEQWQDYNIDSYICYGADMERALWRSYKPQSLVQELDFQFGKRLQMPNIVDER